MLLRYTNHGALNFPSAFLCCYMSSESLMRRSLPSLLSFGFIPSVVATSYHSSPSTSVRCVFFPRTNNLHVTRDYALSFSQNSSLSIAGTSMLCALYSTYSKFRLFTCPYQHSLSALILSLSLLTHVNHFVEITLTKSPKKT